MGAKKDAKATKPQNQLGGTPIRVLAMAPGSSHTSATSRGGDCLLFQIGGKGF